MHITRRRFLTAASAIATDRIKILEDTDADGVADKVTVFADGFSLATGLALGNGGVCLGAAPDLLFLEDTNGDDKADKTTVLKTGFGTEYTVDVAKSGAYELELSVASEGVEPPEIRIEFDGVDVTGPIRPPTTSQRCLFTQILGPTVNLEGGRHVIRTMVVKSPKGTSLNLDYVRFVAKREPKKR